MKGFLCLLLFFTSVAQAASGVYLEAGTGWRWEEEASGVGVNKNGVLAMALGYRLDRLEFAGEFSTFGRTDRDSTLEVERRHYELMAWLRYALGGHAQGTFYAGAGTGFFWENVSTRLLSESSEVAGDPEFVLGGSLDYEYLFAKNWGGGAKLRLLLNTNNSASAVVDTLLRAVYRF